MVKKEGSAKLATAARRVIGFLEELSNEEWDTFDDECYWSCGSDQQRDRLDKMADWAASRWPGDLVEIGCHRGAQTVRLARIAERHDRQVIAIDPWETGVQQCQEGDYEAFLKNIEPFKDRVEVVRLSSQHERAKAIVEKHELCFAFVDGRHTFETALSDILAVSHAQIIAVDDMRYSHEVSRAFVMGAHQIQKTPVHLALWREGYIVSDAALRGRLPE